MKPKNVTLDTYTECNSMTSLNLVITQEFQNTKKDCERVCL